MASTIYILSPPSFPLPLINVHTPNLPIRLLQLLWVALHIFIASLELFEFLGAIHKVSITGDAAAECEVDDEAHVAEVSSGTVRSFTCWEGG